MKLNNSLEINYRPDFVLFERAIKKFQIKKILYRSLFRGKGLEFDGYRFFDQEDDYNSIDWKATLRAGQKIVRKYKEERDVSVYFLVDCSNSMLFGSQKELKAEYAGKVICVLTNLILGSGDRAGLIMYSDKEVKVLSASNKKNQLSLVHKYLSDLSNYGGSFSLENSLRFVKSIIKGPSNNVILISDLIHLKKGFEKSLAILNSSADFFTIMVRDNLDENLPPGSFRLLLKDPSSNKKIEINSKVAGPTFRRFSLNQKERVKKLFKEKGVDLLELNNSKSFILPLSNFIKKRAGETRI